MARKRLFLNFIFLNQMILMTNQKSKTGCLFKFISLKWNLREDNTVILITLNQGLTKKVSKSRQKINKKSIAQNTTLQRSQTCYCTTLTCIKSVANTSKISYLRSQINTKSILSRCSEDSRELGNKQQILDMHPFFSTTFQEMIKQLWTKSNCKISFCLLAPKKK